MQEVYATIAALPEDFRLALVAVDVLGLSYREAARALRVREATITTRLFRARRQVARRLARGGSTQRRPPTGRTAPAAQPTRSAARARPPRNGIAGVIGREGKSAEGVLPSGKTR